MDQNKIESFVSIVETGSITNAAEKLYISQSTLSDRLAALEDELGLRLIERGPGSKKLELTEKGIEFLDFAARYIELNKEMDEWKENRQRLHLKISAPQSVHAYLLKEFYKTYLEKDCHYLDISSHWNRTIYDMVYSFDSDIGIVSRPYQSKQIITKKLLKEPLKIVFDARYASYTSIEELEKKKLIYIGWGPAYEDWFNQQWDPNEPPLISLDSPELLMAYLSSPGAWTILPLCLYDHLIHHETSIKDVHVPEDIYRVLYIIYQKGASTARNALVQDFLKELYPFLKKQEDLHLLTVLMEQPLK